METQNTHTVSECVISTHHVSAVNDLRQKSSRYEGQHKRSQEQAGFTEENSLATLI